jgi:seryl-tRNA synthetase
MTVFEQTSPCPSLLHSMGVGGLFARSEGYEAVVSGLSALISAHRDPVSEILRFPPVMSRAQLEKSGYLHSFPHLLGTVCCLHGTENHIRSAVDPSNAPDDWTKALAATDLVLVPAACYPLYPLVAARSLVHRAGLLFDVACDCFRHEASREAGRLVSFRMREFVCIGTSDQVLDFRRTWMARATELASVLGLANELQEASDPFFGRAGRLMALAQVEQSLKFELLIPIRSETEPTACMSFNYHRDHFSEIWGLKGVNDQVVHTGCVAFGIDRLALALFARHGSLLDQWPVDVRGALKLSL